MKKLISSIAALAAVSAVAGSVSAADWSQASYADNDPATVKMISQDENGITFTNSAENTDICKARITLDKVLKNPEDYANIARMEWTVTYNGVTPELVAEVGLAGGAYVTNTNSSGYTIEPDEYDENEKGIWKQSSYSTADGLTVENPLVKDGEVVFMDWSFADIGGQGVTVTISDWKIFDKDGNEIEQLAYGEWSDAIESDAIESNDESSEENPVETAPPSDDIMTENAKTGNLGVDIALTVCALSGAAAAAVIAKKKK